MLLLIWFRPVTSKFLPIFWSKWPFYDRIRTKIRTTINDSLSYTFIIITGLSFKNARFLFFLDLIYFGLYFWPVEMMNSGCQRTLNRFTDHSFYIFGWDRGILIGSPDLIFLKHQYVRKARLYTSFSCLQENQICQWFAAIMSFSIPLSDFITTDKN